MVVSRFTFTPQFTDSNILHVTKYKIHSLIYPFLEKGKDNKLWMTKLKNYEKMRIPQEIIS